MELGFLDKMRVHTEKALLEMDQAKSEGRKVFGFYCLYSPTEIAVAAGVIPVSLCGTKNDPIEKAEETLPRNLCPLIKSSFGFAASGTCPYFQLSDVVIADTTCDGKKKMFELLAKYRPVHVLQLPQNQDEKQALPFWREEVIKFKQLVERETGKTLSDEDIRDAIKLLNRKRKAQKALMDIAKQKPSPLSGLELIEIMAKTGFFADIAKGVELLEEIVMEIQKNASSSEPKYTENTQRILITGVPIGIGSEKVIRITEEAGANVVCLENCSGYKNTFQVEETGDPIDALSRQYLNVPCSVMSPNNGRLDLLSEMITEFKVDKVIDLTWQACHTYNIEANTVRDFVMENFEIPVLHLETDYSVSDTEQLRTRIEAFLEL